MAITKEELLDLGLDEELVTQVLLKANVPDSPVSALEKALNLDNPQDLIKAETPDDEEGDDEDDGEKKMKKYMKENPEKCKKMMKEAGLFKEKMTKAVDDLDIDMDGDVVQVGDISKLVDSFSDHVSQFADLTKAVSDLSEQVQTISAQSQKTFNIAQASGAVQLELSKASNKVLSKAQGVKGISGVNPQVASDSAQKQFQVNDAKYIHSELTEMTKAGVPNAGILASALESKGMDLNKLNNAQRTGIASLISSKKKGA